MQTKTADLASILRQDDVDTTPCLWSLTILEYSDGPIFQGGSKAWDTVKEVWHSIPIDADSLTWDENGNYVPWSSPRQMWKDANGRDFQVWDILNGDLYCAGDVGLFEKVAADDGLGTNSNDNQVLSDVWGAMQLVKEPSAQYDTLQSVKDVVCYKKEKDQAADFHKTLLDIGIGGALYELAGPVGVAFAVSSMMFLDLLGGECPLGLVVRVASIRNQC